MTFLCHGQSVFICVNPWLKIFRAGGIRTHDLLNPIQAFYQAELRPAERILLPFLGVRQTFRLRE